jgi:capsular exopolysaccharide synthesis family protein
VKREAPDERAGSGAQAATPAPDTLDWTGELIAATPAPADEGTPAEGAEWKPSPQDDVGFCDEGVVTARASVAILESLFDPRSFAGEELRRLGARTQDLRRVRGTSCIALTSPLAGEGKSTISVGLAAALAREPGRRVLLIEADHRCGSLQRTLGIAHSPGLAEWLNGAIDYVPVRVLEPGGFFLLVTGQAQLERPELLGSSRMEGLLRAARGLFDFVILDATPVLPVADAVLIQDLVDGFLVVVRSRKTPKDAIREALARLRPDRVLGVVLNEHVGVDRSYRDQTYQAYLSTKRGR